MQELERSVVGGRKRRGRVVVAAFSLAALGGVAAVALSSYTCEPALVIVEHTSPPIVVTVERPAPPPPAPEPAPAAAPTPLLACPVLDPAADRPIGAVVKHPNADPADADDPRFHVVASAVAPRIAILAGYRAFVSDDDGARFSRAFANHDVQQIAVARDGTLYAIEGDQLGVREFPGTREVWRRVPGAACKGGECPWCDDRIATVDERLVWIHNDTLSVTTDQGRHWKSVSTADTAWSDSTDGRLLAYRGSLYQLADYRDMCGVDDTFVWRLGANAKIDHTIFHNYYESREPVLEPDDDVGSEWRWRERCWDEESTVLTSCTKRVPAISTMLRVATLRPAEGARALAVYSGALIELCEDGARQVYRTFPFSKVDAVDAQGRPLIVNGSDLLRWSPVHGWRRLYKLVERTDE